MTLIPSVCVLSYNRQQWLMDTLNSLSNNTNHPYELIINDDGSDNVEGVELARIKYEPTVIMNPVGWNEGVGRSINKCFKIATGDILIKLDTDLEFAENWLEKVVKLFENNSRLGLLGLCHYHYDPVDMSKTILNHYDDHDEHTHILGSAFAVRREVYEEFGISSYSESFSEDWELMNKICDDPRWYNGLPLEELATNYGMGIGNSTIALDDGNGGVATANIHTQTYKINGNNE
jgi:GT2 family glycosyltransferase